MPIQGRHHDGIFNLGTLAVINSVFDGNIARDGGYGDPRDGGGICNVGMLTVTNSPSSNNTTDGRGGGIYNVGTLTVTNSPFHGNIVDGYFLGGGGGGIANSQGGTVTIINSTIAGNSIGQGSGRGIYNVGMMTLKNTIVANSLPAGYNCTIGMDGITDGGSNLSYPDTTCPGINGDPMFGPLQNNGGPTQTMALLAGNAAIDAALDATCAADPINNFDQRGFIRPHGPHCDIGAYEAGAQPLPVRDYFPYVSLFLPPSR